MRIEIRNDKAILEGYVNAIERESKILQSRAGRFIERIRKGAFFNALKRNDDVHVMLNHERDLGSQKQGNLELTEDAIGLKARAEITDAEVIEAARNDELTGWSFGFLDIPGGVEERDIDGIRHRDVKDMDLREVSILTRTHSPAYEGTLIMARDDEQPLYFGDEFVTDIKTEIREEPEVVEKIKPIYVGEIHLDGIDYSKYEQMIEEMKEGKL